MPNARIQFSTASKEEWEKVNPKLREGEMAVAKKENGKYMLKIGDAGGSKYKDSVLVWDQDDAETKMETATTMAEKAKAAEAASAISAASAKASEEKAAASEKKSTENANKIEAISDQLAHGQLATDWVERLDKKADKGTTLADYGITDARIGNNGYITLGKTSIHPVTLGPTGDITVGEINLESVDIDVNPFPGDPFALDPDLPSVPSRISLGSGGIISLEPKDDAAVKVKNSLTVGEDITAEGTITGSKVFNAVYNDYAEWFERGDDAKAGQIIALDESSDKEQYIKATDKSRAVVGICTNNYAHIIGGENHEDYEAYNLKKFIPVSLAGRVPVYVKGKVEIGDYIAPSDIPGVGRAVKNPGFNTVGMALKGNDDGEIKLIKVLVRR